MLFESKTRPAGQSVHSFLTNLCLILICIYFNQSNNGAQATNSPQSQQQQQQQPTMILKPHQNHRSAQSRDLFQFRQLDDVHLPDQQIYQNYTQHREDLNAGKSIYSSLLKIIYQLRRQIEHERLLSRADDNEDQERIRQVSTKSRPLVFVGTDAANQTSTRDHEQTLTYNVTNEEQQSKPFQVIDQFDSVRNQRNMHEPHDDQFKPTLAPAKLLLQQIPLSSTLAPTFRYSSKFSPLDTTRRWQANNLLEGADDSYDYDENPALFEPAKPSLGSNSLSASIENQYPSTSPKMSRFHSLDFSPNHKLNGKSHKKAEYSSSPSYHRRYGRKSLQLPGMTISPLRPSDYSELSSEANEQHLDGEDNERSNLNGMNPSSTLSTSDHQQNNDRWPKLNPQNIQLQQVYPTTSQTKTQATHSKSSGPARPSIFKTFSSDGQMGAQMSSSSIIGGGGGSGSGSGSGSGGPTLAAFENLASQNQIHLQPQPSQSQPQGDLVNQPQTIQITAIPNSGLGFNNNPIIRIAGNGVAPFGALNGAGLWNNGAGYLDPYGRQVLMVNSERRQNDWSVWFWPILAIVALPLVLGALFVPVFLKTIVVLIQILQSLGLLLPIANALGQQMMLQQASSMPVNTIDNTQKNLSSINY